LSHNYFQYNKVYRAYIKFYVVIKCLLRLEYGLGNSWKSWWVTRLFQTHKNGHQTQ